MEDLITSMKSMSIDTKQESDSLDFFSARNNQNPSIPFDELLVIETLKNRFKSRLTYTSCGITTIFLNPHVSQDIYELDRVQYFREQPIQKLEPHIFAVAEKTYRRLKRENHDQSIVLTGESGSGKTENANYAIAYLATISAENAIREKVLAASNILEACGNASTICNRNSSRFGRYMEIEYDARHQIIGAHVKTFFLDRSRIVSQEQGEKNFKVFYLLKSGGGRFSSQLSNHHFNYLRQGSLNEENYEGNVTSFDGLVHALNLLDFSPKVQDEMFHILVAILYLGNLTFQRCESQPSNEDRESCLISELGSLEELLKISNLEPKAIESMSKWMCYKKISSNKDDVLQPMTVAEASRARDALAKFLYTELFNFIVARINSSLRSPCHVQSIIGVVDLWGFEKLGCNSFEQLCINFVDEKIQQFFLQSTFVLEQEEYVMEGISWSSMTFKNNKMIVELLEGKHGIISLIDEGNLGFNYTNTPWTVNLLSRYGRTGLFRKSENSGSQFMVRHFMRDVQYDIASFVEKNQYIFIKEQLRVFKASKNDLLRKLVMDKMLKSKSSEDRRTKTSLQRRSSLSSKPNKKTVISDFRIFLSNLLSSIKNTTPNFVRCIKTNDEDKAFSINTSRFVEQVQALNILDTMKISSLGYFYQRTYEDFYQRYHCLCKFELIKRNDFVNMSKIILTSHLQDSSEEGGRFALGKTKVFLDEVATSRLEEARSRLRNRSSVLIQARARRLLQQRHYSRLRRSTLLLQRRARQFLEKRRQEQKTTRAAILIQSRVRGFLERRRLLRDRESLVASRHERQLARAATLVQSSVRGFLARRASQRRLRDVVVVQACARRFLAGIRARKERANRATRLEMINRNLERQIQRAQHKIDFLMEKYFYTNDFETVKATVDDRACVETKNKLLTEILNEKIQVLKDFFKLHPQGYHNDPEDRIEDRMDSQVDDLDGSERRDFHACRRIYLKQYDFFEPVMRNEYDLECYQPLLHSYRKFDQRAESLMTKLGLDETDIQRFRISHGSPILDGIDPDKPSYLGRDQIDRELREIEFEDTSGHGGILQFQKEDIDSIIDQLVTGTTPSSISAEFCRAPAQVVFMCLRHCDAMNDSNTGIIILQKYLTCVRETVKQSKDFDTIVFWLANTHQLLNYMKQFSKINTVDNNRYQEANTSRQEASSLSNIDLSISWDAFSGTGQWLVGEAVKQMNGQIHGLIVPALLENEEIQDLYKNDSDYQDLEPDNSDLHLLVEKLDNFNRVFTRCCICRRMKIEMFKQVFDFISSICLNNIMTQTKFCNNLKGTFIRSNFRYVENWAVKNFIATAIEAFDPVAQAARLLQMQPLNEALIDWICKRYTKLNTYQIVEIMSSYVTNNNNEPEISPDVLKELQRNLAEREQLLDDTILIDEEKYPVALNFEYSQASFDTMKIPDMFKLSSLLEMQEIEIESNESNCHLRVCE